MRFMLLASFALLLGTACDPPDAMEADDLMRNIDEHIGERVVVKGKFRSGARCKQDEGEWKTYCKDCQVCRGPLVLESKVGVKEVGDWPLVLGGTYEGQDIRCTGKLNDVKCHPLKPGETYVIQGYLEASHPPKLIVREYWEVDS